MMSFVYKGWVLFFVTSLLPLLAFAGKKGGGGYCKKHGCGGGGRKDVPEIDMAEGLAAVAIVIAVMLLLREYYKRRAVTQ